MKIKVGINGMGRICRKVVRLIKESQDKKKKIFKKLVLINLRMNQI